MTRGAPRVTLILARCTRPYAIGSCKKPRSGISVDLLALFRESVCEYTLLANPWKAYCECCEEPAQDVCLREDFRVSHNFCPPVQMI